MTTSSAGRVDTDHRHDGLFTHFTNLVQLEMKNNYPLLKFDLSLSPVSEKVVKRYRLANGRLLCQKVEILKYESDLS